MWSHITLIIIWEIWRSNPHPDLCNVLRTIPAQDLQCDRNVLLLNGCHEELHSVCISGYVGVTGQTNIPVNTKTSITLPPPAARETPPPDRCHSNEIIRVIHFT